MLRKATTILSLFSQERPEWSAPEVAGKVRRPKSTVYRLMAQMAEAGFLDQDRATGQYRVGILLASYGEVARRSTSLQRVAYPHLLRATESTGESSVLMVRSGHEGVTIDLLDSYQPLRIPQHLGGRFPLHATAGGRVFLAWMPETDVDAILRGPLVCCTPRTLTGPAAIRRELALTRKRGYAIGDGEWVEDVCAVAAPIRDHRGAVVAAVAASSPRPRWSPKKLKTLVAAAVTAGQEISRALGYR